MPLFFFWAFLLASIPWTPFFFRGDRAREKRVFPALRLLNAKAARRRSIWRRAFVASARSLALVSVLFLWHTREDAAKQSARQSNETRETTLEPRVCPNPIDALIVDGSDTGASRAPDASRRLSTAEYFALALDPWETNERDYRITRVYATEFDALTSSELARHDVVVLADLAALTEKEQTKLTEYSREPNRAVVFVPGARTDVDAWNETWRRLGWNLTTRELATTEKERRVTPGAFAERIPDFDGSGLSTPPLTRAIVTDGAASSVCFRARTFEAPLFTRLQDAWYWQALSPDAYFGELPQAVYFTTLVDETLRYALTAPEPTASKRVASFELRVWAALMCVFAALGEFFLRRRRR